MSRSVSDRALVLRVWSVGETDRFCFLLTEHHGRISVRVPGARRALSRRGRGLLPFHIVDVTWSENGDVHYVTAASCVDPNSAAWMNTEALTMTQQGIALILRLTEEGVPMPDVFALTEDFLSACDGQSPVLLDLFAIKLLRLFGSFPSATHSLMTGQRFHTQDDIVWSIERGGFVSIADDVSGFPIDPATHRLLGSIDTISLHTARTCTPETSMVLHRIVQGLVPIQLGTSLPAVSPRILASSSAVTPI